jgi:hypothetical protein
MPRKSKFPLDPIGREILPYRGEWERLAEILAPKKIRPSTFLREVIHRTIRRAEEHANKDNLDLPEIDLETSDDDNEPT